jgi:hypothetical protein
MRRPAVVEDDDARFRFAECARRRASRRSRLLGSGRASLQQVRPHEPGEAQPADAQNFTACDAVAQANALTEDGKHE